MYARLPNLLNTSAKLFLAISAITFFTGLTWIIADAPCSDVGAYITLSSIALTALSSCLLLISALLKRAAWPLAFGVGAAAAAVVQYFFYGFTAVMLCHGV